MSAIVWNCDDQRLAYTAGWGIFNNSDFGLQIERLDDPSSVGLSDESPFDSDEEASAYLKERAADGDKLAIKALAFIEQENAKRSPSW